MIQSADEQDGMTVEASLEERERNAPQAGHKTAQDIDNALLV
jgi:hypothetical protein